MPDFSTRSRRPEIMDDLAISGEELQGALRALGIVNRLLGGYRVTLGAIRGVTADPSRPLTVVDLGAGLGDHAVELVRWGARIGREVHVTAVDANPATLALAREYRDRKLPLPLRTQIRFVDADAMHLPFEDDTFDVALATLFLHHFDDDTAPSLLAEMARVAARAVVINDLHRHPLAWASFRVLSHLVPAPSMFREDGELSVRKGFTRQDLQRLASIAGLPEPRISWSWAFRWSFVSRLDGEST